MKKDKLIDLFKEFEMEKTFTRNIKGGYVGAGTGTGTETGYTTYGGDGKSTGCDDDCESDT